ncbi:MAG TPA: protease HtpX [Myxococcales bacterium LLY-WYZ-16_1]|nr:protease HtpX [Myxococcales bacterium LLY-WYZ-16_1]
MKRILLFVGTNIAVLVVLSIVTSLLGVDRWITQQGINPVALLGFAAVFGFGGAFISLAISKRMALWTTGAKIIQQPSNESEAWLVSTVGQLARQSGIGQPDVAIYPGAELNAFATGMRRDKALVAVSQGLLQGMRREEVEAVLAHEVSHVANGDMVTMTLLQGVLNTFVIAVSRVVGWAVGRFAAGEDEEGGGISYLAYIVTTIAAQILLGIGASLIVMAFSRHREFRADAGAAQLVGAGGMVAALKRLGAQSDEASELPEPVEAFGIRGGKSWMKLFASHPPLEKRIAALQSR